MLSIQRSEFPRMGVILTIKVGFKYQKEKGGLLNHQLDSYFPQYSNICNIKLSKQDIWRKDES